MICSTLCAYNFAYKCVTNEYSKKICQVQKDNLSVYIFFTQTSTICMVPKGEEKISIEFVKRSPRPFSFLHSICFVFLAEDGNVWAIHHC